MNIPLARPAAAVYIPGMNGFLLALVALALFAVLAVLMTGVLGMAKGGAFNRRYGNVLMRWRVALQGLAVLLILFAALLSRG